MKSALSRSRRVIRPVQPPPARHRRAIPTLIWLTFSARTPAI